MSFSLNLNPIIKAAEQAFIETNQELGELFQAEVPVRTGALKNSYQLTFPTPDTANHEWTKDYAIYVHEDITLKNGKVRKGRHWTHNGLSKFQEIYNRKLQEKLQ